MSSSHRSRLTVHPISIAAFTLLASALLLGLPAQSSAQGQAAADIQLTADQTLSTTTTVEAQGGQAVVIEIFGTGFTDAVGLEVYVGVDDPTAISGTPTVLGNPTYFPPSPFAGVEVGDSSFKGNLSAAFLGAGFNKITVTDTAPQYLGEMTFVLADGFQAVTFTVTRVVFSGSVGGSDGVLPNVVLTATNPTAGPKTFGADLDPAPGNQGVLSRRANPNVRLPVQTFAGKVDPK